MLRMMLLLMMRAVVVLLVVVVDHVVACIYVGRLSILTLNPGEE